MQVHLYDTTLRDGMQGEGMSLSADEKVRVAHALDGLGVHLIEAGFPSSNPKEEALFELLERETLRVRGHRRVRDDAPARRRAPTRIPALRLLADCFAPVCTLVGKTWALHLEKVTRVDPEENLRMIEESVRFLRDAGQARHLRRRALLRRLPRRPGLCASLPARGRGRRRRERHALRHERLVASGAGRRGDRAGGGGARRERSGRHPHPRRRRLRRGELARGRRAGRPARPGHDERLRRAVRQREPRLDPARAPAQDGPRVRPAGPARRA